MPIAKIELVVQIIKEMGYIVGYNLENKSALGELETVWNNKTVVVWQLVKSPEETKWPQAGQWTASSLDRCSEWTQVKAQCTAY